MCQFNRYPREHHKHLHYSQLKEHSPTIGIAKFVAITLVSQTYLILLVNAPGNSVKFVVCAGSFLGEERRMRSKAEHRVGFLYLKEKHL